MPKVNKSIKNCSIGERKKEESEQRVMKWGKDKEQERPRERRGKLLLMMALPQQAALYHDISTACNRIAAIIANYSYTCKICEGHGSEVTA